MADEDWIDSLDVPHLRELARLGASNPHNDPAWSEDLRVKLAVAKELHEAALERAELGATKAELETAEAQLLKAHILIDRMWRRNLWRRIWNCSA
jgi:hypothetical protein